MKRLALLVALSGSVAWAQPTVPLRFSKESPLSCPTEAVLGAAIGRNAPRVKLVDGLPRRGEHALRVTVEADLRLRIDLVDPTGAVVTRSLRVPAEQCDEAAEAVGLLVSTWMAPMRRKPRVSRRAVVRAVEPPPSSSPVEPIEPGEPGEPGEEDEEIAAEAPAPPDRPERDPPPPPVARPSTAWRTLQLTPSIAALGAISLERAPRPLGQAVLTIELGIGRRWGIGLRAQAGSTLEQPAEPGRIALRRAPLLIYGRLALHSPERSGVALLAGIFADLLVVETEGYSAHRRAWLVDPGAWLGVRGELLLRRHLVLQLCASTSILFRTSTFAVRDLGPVQSTPRAFIELSGGIGWRFF